VYQKLKAIVIWSVILTISLSICSFVLFKTGLIVSRSHRFKKISQQEIHGVIQNTTSHPVRITDYTHIFILPPHKTSLDVDVWDADSLVIDRATKIDGQMYGSGVFKFCDFGYLKLKETGAFDEVLPNRRAVICRFLNDFHHYDSIRAAFVDRHP
jgi:hypothetical protein